MAIKSFYRQEVRIFETDKGIEDPNVAYRITVDEYDSDDNVPDLIDRFCDDPKVKEVKSLVIGLWGEAFDNSSTPIVEKLVERKEALGHLEALFFGDMDAEECEISWIMQSDVTAIFEAFPNLKHLCLKGGNELTMKAVKHDKLESLAVYTGGMLKEFLEGLAGSNLPKLRYLELWLGTDDYGFDGSVEDVKPLLKKGLFPNLHYLGLQNSSIADEVALAIAETGLQDTIRCLDLSMGVMTKAGMIPLLESEALDWISYLNVENNYLDNETMKRMEAELSELEVQFGEQKEDEDDDDEPWRYVDVGE